MKQVLLQLIHSVWLLDSLSPEATDTHPAGEWAFVLVGAGVEQLGGRGLGDRVVETCRALGRSPCTLGDSPATTDTTDTTTRTEAKPLRLLASLKTSSTSVPNVPNVPTHQDKPQSLQNVSPPACPKCPKRPNSPEVAPLPFSPKLTLPVPNVPNVPTHQSENLLIPCLLPWWKFIFVFKSY